MTAKPRTASLAWATVAVSVAMLVMAASSLAATRHAAPTPGPSADPNVCAQAQPCTIEDAMNSTYTVDGDDVLLAPGDYTVTTTLGIIDTIEVHGTGSAAQTRIHSTANPFGIAVNNAGAILRNVTVLHGTGNEAAIRLMAGVVHNTVAISASAHGCTARDGMFRDSLCLSKANGYTGIFVNEGGGAPSLLRLRNVTAVGAGTGSHGIRIYASSSLAATIDAIGTIAVGDLVDVSARTDGSLGSSATINLDHSNFSTTLIDFGIATITDPLTGGNQTAAPAFVNAAIDDYHQAVGSPTINAGATDGYSGAFDIDGDARVLGPAVDIGYDEFVPPASPPVAPPADTTAPNTAIKKKPRKRTTSRRAKFTFGSNEAGSTFRCKLDRGSYRRCDTSFRKSVRRGKHVLRVVAVDAAGNIDPTPAVWRWRVIRD